MSYAMSKDTALSLLNYFGIPWRIPDGRDYRNISGSSHWGIANSWTGEELVIPNKREGEQICHEACHWLLASEEDRLCPEFNLGKPPYEDVAYDAFVQRKTYDRAIEIEISTCLLEIYLFKASHRSWRLLAADLNFSDVPNFSTITFEEFVDNPENLPYWKDLVAKGSKEKIDSWVRWVGVAPTISPSKGDVITNLTTS